MAIGTATITARQRWLTIITIAEMEREEMNKDKAIQLLERLQDPEPYEPMLTKDAYDAIQMAIDALSADGDTISREAAIEALDDAENAFGYLTRDWREVLMELPSVQLVPDIDEITCESCEYSERYVDGLILCRRTKTSHRVSATSTCGKGKREVEDAEAKI
jgi:hypothetical protein